MLKFGNKEFRNLQEQVEKNMKDILFILQEEGVLNEFGIKVVGQEALITNMPTVEDYKEAHEDWSYGDTYAIGTEAPYTLYVLTRANGTHPNDYWFNIGRFPVEGPQGPQGPQGETGPQGQTGNPGVDGASAGFGAITATAITLDPDEEATASVVASGPNTEKSFAFTFGIPKGESGGGGGTDAIWGNITGDISNQTDLVSALQGKQNTLVSGTNIKTISGNSILGSGDIKVSQLQATATIVIDALTNLNGRIISNYEATLDTSTSYTYYVITRNGSQLTEEQARDYMEYMTGSRFLPVFDYETPENSLFVFANGSLWKPQFDNEGLKLYALPNPYASKVDLTNYVDLTSAQTITSTKTFVREIDFKYSDSSTYKTGIVCPGNNKLGFGNAPSSASGINSYITMDFSSKIFYPGQNGQYSLGTINGRWNHLFLKGTLRDGNNNNYGLAIPDTTSFTANKTIATIDDIPTDYVDLTSAQTITGKKTFNGNIGVNNEISFSSSGTIRRLGSSVMTFDSNSIIFYQPPRVSTDGGQSLGTSTRRWNHLFLKGNLSDGTNAVSVAQIASGIGGTYRHVIYIEGSSADITIAVNLNSATAITTQAALAAINNNVMGGTATLDDQGSYRVVTIDSVGTAGSIVYLDETGQHTLGVTRIYQDVVNQI